MVRIGLFLERTQMKQELWADIRNLFKNMSVVLLLKTSFVKELPAMVVHAGTPEGARRCIALYREQIEAGRTPHRVADFFLAQYSTLRKF